MICITIVLQSWQTIISSPFSFSTFSSDRPSVFDLENLALVTNVKILSYLTRRLLLSHVSTRLGFWPQTDHLFVIRLTGHGPILTKYGISFPDVILSIQGNNFLVPSYVRAATDAPCRSIWSIDRANKVLWAFNHNQLNSC